MQSAATMRMMVMLVAMICASGTASGQDETCNSAIYNLPDGYTIYDVALAAWDKDVVEIVVEEVNNKTQYSSWATNSAWACGMFQSGTLTPPPNEPRIWKKTYNWCVSIEGNATYMPRVELAASLVTLLEGSASLGSEFGLGGNWTYCETTEYQINYAPALAQCWHTHARVVWTESSVRGVVTEAQSRFWWRPLYPAGRAIIPVLCGVRVSTGKAYDRKSDDIQHAPKTPNCEVGPGTPFTNPDPWDGRCIEPCCRPVLSCDIIQHPTQPCCGIMAEF